MVNEILGANIRKYRLAFNWTQEKLADILCVSHQVISKWENGIAAPDIAILCSLTRIFNVSLDDLCGVSPKQIDDFYRRNREYNSKRKYHISIFAYKMGWNRTTIDTSSNK